MSDKKVILSSPADSVIKPSDVTRMMPAAPAEAAPSEEDIIETSNVTKMDAVIDDKPKRTIKLKPVRPAGGDGSEQKTVAMTSEPPVSEEDETVKIQKPVRATATPPVPGVKQTIKLRPSSSTVSAPNAETPPPASSSTLKIKPEGEEDQTVAMSKKTIRLVAKREDGGAVPAAPAPVSPSAPTMKFQESAPIAPMPPQPPPRSAVTVKLSEPQSQSDTNDAQTAPVKRTLRLKPVKSGNEQPAAAPAVQAAPAPMVADATDAEMAAAGQQEMAAPPMPEAPAEGIAEGAGGAIKSEPSIIFTIAACLTFFVIAYFALMIVGQFANLELDKNISVPGLSGKVK